MALRNYLSLVVAAVGSFSLMCFSSASWSEELSIQVQGLFKNTAIVSINGTQRTLKVGKISPEGVLLKSANTQQAVIEYQGKEQILDMNSSAPVAFETMTSAPEPANSKLDLRLVRQSDGMFRVSGTINNTAVQFLVDTGASSIAMNHYTAQRIGIPYKAQGIEIVAATASGMVKAYQVTLSKVRVGDLELSNVEGAVIEGTQPEKVLLGMSFLGHFKVQQDGNQMIIGTRH